MEEGKIIYFDNAATTKISENVNMAMVPYWTNCYGNASGKYALGYKSRDAIEKARKRVARAINAEPNEIYFTSGATEGNNWIVGGKYIITTPIEHHSVLYACKEANLLPVDKTGHVVLYDYERLMRLNDNLVSVMLVNNEIGTIQDIKKLAEIAHNNGHLFHTDATQAIGHTPVDVKDLDVDFMTASAHKFNGPKGVGFVYIKNGIEMTTFHKGGQQEQGLRAGTEPVSLIVGLGEAIKESSILIQERANRSFKLGEYFRDQLKQFTKLITHYSDSRRYINISFANYGIRGEKMMSWLCDNDIYCSTGSACNSKDNKPSHVLLAIGCSEDDANGSVRFSINEDNTKEEIDEAVSMISFGLRIFGK